jgi:Ca-activated chloride channel family protein
MMELWAITSGWSVAVSELTQFLAVVRLARPGGLVIAIVPLLLSCLSRIQTHRLKRRMAALGDPNAIPLQIQDVRLRGFGSMVVISSFWFAFALAVSGPRWGRGDDGGVAIGRDVVLGIDLSRSMLAEDLSAGGQARWQSAVAEALEVVEAAAIRGGHRIGVVIFAARAKTLVPLTTDYAHVRDLLKSLDATRIPDEIRPADDRAKSGTRLGAGLQQCVSTHDLRFPGFQDIILLTDADDPVSDQEWQVGVAAAREAKIPVHVVGIGDPDHDSLVFLDGQPIEGPDANGVRVQALTKLQAELARRMADEARGSYLPAQRGRANLGEFFHRELATKPSRELTDDPHWQLQDRSVWFYILASILLLILWWRE